MPKIAGLGDFTEIGRGGFGIVYRADDAAHGRTVAVKVLRHSLDESGQARFERECRAAGSLSGHPNIVSIHGSGTTTDGDPYLVMDHLPGGSLAERVHANGPLDAEAAIDLGIALSGALAAAHSRGIIHRDVKPENVLFSAFGLPQLVDFGIARMASEFETQSGSISASLLHAPPEVISGEPPSPAGDVYSLASMLHFALSGAPPFERSSEESLAPLIARITSASPPDLRAGGVPDELAEVIERGLAKAPADRPESAEAFGEALRAAGLSLGQRPPALPIGLPPSSVIVPGPDPDQTRDVAALTPPASVPPAADEAGAPVATTAGSARSRQTMVLAAVGVVVLLVVGVVLWSSGDGEKVGTGGSTTTNTTTSEVIAAPRVVDPTAVENGLSVGRRYSITKAGAIGSSVLLANATDKTIKRVWAEVVPKELAKRVADVDFSTKPTGIIRDDPIVYWVVTLGPGAQQRIAWTTPLPAGVDGTQAYLERVVQLHRSAVKAAADEIRYASKAVERDTGAEGVDPNSTVEKPGDPTNGNTTTTTADPGGGGDNGNGGTTDPGGGTVVERTTTTRAPIVTTTTRAPVAKPGAPTNVVVRDPVMVSPSNPKPGGYAVKVQLSWSAPTSGGPVSSYVVRRQEFWYSGCGSSRSNSALTDVTTTSSRSVSVTTTTVNGCGWVVWQVAAKNASGTGSATIATGVVPTTRNLGWAYHLVRAIGGKAVHGDDQDCGAALYEGCGTSPTAGSTINAGTQVWINEQAAG